MPTYILRNMGEYEAAQVVRRLTERGVVATSGMRQGLAAPDLTVESDGPGIDQTVRELAPNAMRVPTPGA